VGCWFVLPESCFVHQHKLQLLWQWYVYICWG
jgi:hypothetical protein